MWTKIILLLEGKRVPTYLSSLQWLLSCPAQVTIVLVLNIYLSSMLLPYLYTLLRCFFEHNPIFEFAGVSLV